MQRENRNETVATVDVEPAPYEDVNETTFDDDFREKRHLLPAGDIVLDFISAVRHDSSRQQQDFFAGLTQTCLAYARSLAEFASDSTELTGVRKIPLSFLDSSTQPALFPLTATSRIRSIHFKLESPAIEMGP